LATEIHAIARSALACVLASRRGPDFVAGTRRVVGAVFHLAHYFKGAASQFLLFNTDGLLALFNADHGGGGGDARTARGEVVHRARAAFADAREIGIDARVRGRRAFFGARATVVVRLRDAHAVGVALAQRTFAHVLFADAGRVLGLVPEADAHAHTLRHRVLVPELEKVTLVQDALAFGARELSGAVVVGGAHRLGFARYAVDGLVGVLVVVLVLGWALDLVAGPARPVKLAARRFLGRGSADRLRVAERRREHEREERDERELHRGATPHDQVWEGGGEEGGRKRVRWSRQGRVKRYCAVPLREHVKFSRATSVFSVVGIENARSNRPSTTAWRPAPSCGMSRAPRRLPVLSFPRRVSLRKRVDGFEMYDWMSWQQNQVSLVSFIGPRGCLGKDDAGSRPRRLRGRAVE